MDNMTEGDSKRRHGWPKYLMLALALPVLMLSGGYVVGWLTEGPILYSYSTITVPATVKANGTGSLPGEQYGEVHFLVLSYSDCADVRQAIPVPDRQPGMARHEGQSVRYQPSTQHSGSWWRVPL